MNENERAEWHRKQALKGGSQAIAAVISGFQFLMDQLTREEERYAELAEADETARAQTTGEDADASRRTQQLVDSLARVGQIAASQHNAHVDQIVRAAAKLISPAEYI